MLGYASEKEVTLATYATMFGPCGAAPEAAIIGDLPYMTYETPDMALANARLVIEAGADIVKFEGPRADIVETLVGASIDVCCHLGLEPQHHAEKRFKGVRRKKPSSWCKTPSGSTEQACRCSSSSSSRRSRGRDLAGDQGSDDRHRRRAQD